LTTYNLELLIKTKDEIQDEIIYYFNKFRKEQGLSNVVYESLLEVAGQRQADDLRDNNRFGHQGIDGSNMCERICEIGLKFYAGYNENALASAGFPDEAIESWKNSSGHRRAMMYEQHDSTALGFAVHTADKSSGGSSSNPGFAKWTLMMANTETPDWDGAPFTKLSDD
jgi:uncharacterized protein YkwD